MLVKSTEAGNTDTGQLRCGVFIKNRGMPVSGAKVIIRAEGRIVEQLTTDSDGQTESIRLAAPPLEYSLGEASGKQPYATYNISFEAPGFKSEHLDGVQVLPDVTALANTALEPQEQESTPDTIIISPHTLWGDFPPKIPEADAKPMPEASGFVVLSQPVVPELIVVHDGHPDDSKAKNHWVPFKDYIKNVASSEIYPTWPRESIAANVLAILSFTLNRVFTEWYRAKGKDFTITSSTAFDHAFVPGRNIFAEISNIVDEIFTSYITRPGIEQPLFSQYCDGKRVQCPNWMTQWGSKDLADKGYSAVNILKNFYGNEVFLQQALKVAGVPSSYPGSSLGIDASGDNVRTIQRQLNAIADNYPGIKKIAADGVFGQATADAVRAFQGIFNMPQNGIVDFATWYKISDIFVAVTKMATGVPMA